MLGVDPAVREEMRKVSRQIMGLQEIVDLPLGVSLVDDLEVKEEELLDGVIFGEDDVADDSDEEVRDDVAVEEGHDGR
ncbi:coatomer subunit beta-1-like [Pyrus ussuriensis x Pyrus communis]|uniref:Coatomer subunit beta-1-like n=1 Tax=Pyrus ussuriensis x Pyrus communis TaxID=2448454 RepID=A0A5N5GSF7_9ROSA|nr:coatomer subunit beta-1-like [Pyrus ussuriensis x Pyrus communis]